MPFQRPAYRPKYPPSYVWTQSGHQRIDYGFDWHEIIAQESVTRLIVTPYFDEASALLTGAARLWRGRLGDGRVRGGELHQLAQKLRNDAQNWRRAGLSWADSGLHKRRGKSGEEVGYYLSIHADTRSTYFTSSDELKHPMAARRMVEAAIRLIAETDELIRVTGQRLYADKVADGWQNHLEKLGESPCSEPADPPLSDDAYGHLRSRAFLRACEGLCHIVVMLRLSDESKTGKAWWERVYWYGRAAENLYERFVAEAPSDEREALMAAKDTASAYCHVTPSHMSMQQLARAGRVVESLLAVFTRWMDEGHGTPNDRLALPPADTRLIES